MRAGRNEGCGHALIVKEGDKNVNYYLDDKGDKEPYHKHCCTADDEGVKVTGKVGEKDGKKIIEEPKVEIKEVSRPERESTRTPPVEGGVCRLLPLAFISRLAG